MDNYLDLINTANALRTVKVDGDFWMLMQASVNTILKVAEAIKPKEKQVVKKDEPVNNNS